MNFARAPSRDAAHPVTGPEGERLRLPGGRPGGFVCPGSKVVPTRSTGVSPRGEGVSPRGKVASSEERWCPPEIRRCPQTGGEAAPEGLCRALSKAGPPRWAGKVGRTAQVRGERAASLAHTAPDGSLSNVSVSARIPERKEPHPRLAPHAFSCLPLVKCWFPANRCTGRIEPGTC